MNLGSQSRFGAVCARWSIAREVHAQGDESDADRDRGCGDMSCKRRRRQPRYRARDGRKESFPVSWRGAGGAGVGGEGVRRTLGTHPHLERFRLELLHELAATLELVTS